MGRAARKQSEPYIPRPKKVELTSEHAKRKAIFTVVFLAIAVAAFVYGFMQLLRDESGWQQIEVLSSGNVSCGDQFVLLYNVGAGGASAKEEKRALTSLYSDAAVTAYRLFTNDESFDGVANVRYLNEHPNETVTVDPALYHAFAQIQQAGDRSLYLGPVSRYYDNIFYCEDSALTAEFDPRQNEEIRQYFADCCAFVNDPAAVDVELLEGDQVRLRVSEAYLAFAQDQGIDTFVDFYWMKNAFIADYMAQRLMDAGYVYGALSSCDGFIRNLADPEVGDFGFNIYDGSAGQPVLAATMAYSGSMAIVYLRSYPMNEMDAPHYVVLAAGEIRSAYLDPADGLCRAAIDDLTVYSREEGCAATLLRVLPLYVTDTFRPEALQALTAEGVYSVYCRDGSVLYNDADLTLTAVSDGDGEGSSYETVLQA